MSNAHKARPEIILKLDKDRKFVFDMNGLCTAEEKLGKSVFKCVNWKDLGVRDLRLLLWAGLLGDDPTLTQQQIGEMFHSHNIAFVVKEIQALVETALDAAMPFISPDEIAAIDEQKKKVGKQVTKMKDSLEKSTGSNSKPLQ